MSRATIDILLASAPNSIEVAFTLPGGTGVIPSGGVAGSLLQKQSGVEGDVGWTRIPSVAGLALDLVTPDPTFAKGTTRWNIEDGLTETNLGGAPGQEVILQNGFETLILGANFTGVTIPKGRVVAFAGVDITSDAPKMQPMIADGSISPLYTIGLTAEDVPDTGTVGRVISLGELYNVDTTGGAEAWAQGDLLYVSPTIAGTLTKIEPPPPAVSTLVAVVLKVHATTGVLLVRPEIAPRLQYGTFSRVVDQTFALVNTPYAALFDMTNLSSGVSLGSPASRVIVASAGLYNFEYSLQVQSGSPSLSDLKIWARVNGIDVPYSLRHSSITGNGASATPSRTFALPMTAGSYFELMIATGTTALFLHADPATGYNPAGSSVALTVAKLNQ